MRRGQETIHDAREGVGGLVGKKGLHLFRRRRQARQIKACPANQRPPVRGRGGPEPVRLERRKDEAVDARLRPRRVVHLGKRRRPHRLERPEAPLFVGEYVFFILTVPLCPLLGLRLGPGQAKLDPALQLSDLLWRQLGVGRHLERVLLTNRLDEQALFGLPRHRGRAAVAAAQDGCSRS